ncbi:glutamine--fructose-6-phosphate transaminase (isomerizing) [Caviibacter abscessus]|uniref:glutamine--fructose-6-phosphate transaminase (isomerizing) n=1 Tax=Caviibacter abscessus TaxID=1766719 RepID=UPI00083751C7|nr:glutamine--fructose-6-phosphate transaminase (isomerizing) [Caviibacter abscessus]
MCGIVGYIGNKNATQFVLNGLEKLEYRGYDSSGIATIYNGKINVKKKKGRIQVLKNELSKSQLLGNIAIGHTRWATHGEPSDINAHPHVDEKGEFAVVHNGIIENYTDLKEMLEKKGYHFISCTDTEVIVHLLSYYKKDSLLETVYEIKKHLKGAYVLGIISKNDPDTLIAVRNEGALIVGKGYEENFISSDISAILEHTKDVYFIENGEIVVLTKDNISIFNENLCEIKRELCHLDLDVQAANKNGYPHFMLKEIFEQPQAVENTIKRKLNEQGTVDISNIQISKEYLKNINKIYIVACGTAYNAGCIGKYAVEKLAKIPVYTEIASEFRYNCQFIDEKTLVIIVSQSGETADTLAALRQAKQMGAKIFSITNVVGSSIARESDYVFYTWAGPEIAVASTKAYITQLVAMYLIAMDFGYKNENLDIKEYKELLNELLTLPSKIEKILSEKDKFKKITNRIKDSKAVFYLGRGIDYMSAMEAALKLKEISYIFTEAFAAGELKHGTIALIEKDIPVITIATQENLVDKIFSNIQEVKARKADTISIIKENYTNIYNISDEVIIIPDTIDLFMPILSIIPTQLMAYYASILNGNDVDKPRNLAKSVTVE